MNSTIRQTNQVTMLFAVIAASFLTVSMPSTSHADGWELRTVTKEVPGTREIESGNPEKAIRISKVHLAVTEPRLKVAVLTNLCIGHILIKDFEQAELYCDQAVAMPNERTVSYNNLGVLKAMQGDYAAALQSFTIAADAGCLNGCDATTQVPQDLPRPVARRNLDKAETRVAEARDATETDRVAARAEQ